MQHYSVASLLRRAVDPVASWPAMWRTPEPQAQYDVVIVGAGGHGLATAYYLATEHGITNVAVIEKGWLGGGNSGRNTTIVRSNYLFPESAHLYDFALKRYEGLSQDLNYNVMLSQRGVAMLAHSRHDMESCTHWANAMRLNGIDSDILSAGDVKRLIPFIDDSATARYPVHGGFIQRRGGVARHDAVAWGYARGADRRGVDILQNCEVTGFLRGPTGAVTGVETTRGAIRAKQVALTAAGNTSVLATMAGFRLPLQSYALQAMVSEPVKPFFDTVAISLATGLYLSQSDKGELVFGAGLDLYHSYAQRGNYPVTERVMASAVAMFPALSRLKLLRQWAGLVDVSPDSSPILGPSPVEGLFLNCGWGTGGFKAIPVGGYMLAWQLATGAPHPIAAPFGLDRFSTAALVDEAAAAGIPH
ncbi:sarcosine oxidase subunit beta family protein [Azorhizobium sp. AG788]|uniref:sarcosine oxidase subunit beta family protein n=1 Tax=Azorhizobium sp. AG788 TaxID=2183897 RepID=UPI0031395A66